MNVGTCILLIFLFIVAAFAGLGYVVPELNQKSSELDALNGQLASIRVELKSTQKALTDERLAHETSKNELRTLQARLHETEVAREIILAQYKDLESALVSEQAARQKADQTLEQVLLERNEQQKRVQDLYSLATNLTAGVHGGSIFSEYGLNRPQSGSTITWLLSLVVLVVSSISSYRIAWRRRGYLNNVIAGTQHGKQSPSNHQKSNSQYVTVRIPRERVAKFSKWLRTGRA